MQTIQVRPLIDFVVIVVEGDLLEGAEFRLQRELTEDEAL